jgi:putative membrane protein
MSCGTLDCAPMAADPDTRARTHMANERTFLAWFRTGITLLALGIAAAQFLGVNAADPRLVQGLAAISIVTGGIIVGIGGARYWTGKDRIEAETFRPAQVSIVVSTVGAVAMAVLAVGFVLLLGRT